MTGSLLEEQLRPLVAEITAGRLTIEEATDFLTGSLDGAMGDDLPGLLSWPMTRRPEQQTPAGAWSYWLLSGGRGSGKTKTGGEWVCDRIEEDRCHAGIFVGRTPAEVRSIMIEGESGFLASAEARGLRPRYYPSRRLIKIPGGGKIETRSAQVPDETRGGNHDTGWADEFAAWPRRRDPLGNTAFSNLEAALRAGPDPRMILTTTPKAVPEIDEAMRDARKPGSVWTVTRMPTWANRAHLPRSFIRRLLQRYGGTRLAAQEFDGLYVADVEGALWTTPGLEFSRVLLDTTIETPMGVHMAKGLRRLDELGVALTHTYVAVDPSAAEDGEGDECGIVVGGIGSDRRFYVIGDFSGHLGPSEWSAAALSAYRASGALSIVAEGNKPGGALVRGIMHATDPSVPVEIVHARQGKRARAEPVAILWDGDDRTAPRASMVGYFPELEAELTGWDSRSDARSPNRLDALAWLGTKAAEHLYWTPTAASDAFSGVRLPL